MSRSWAVLLGIVLVGSVAMNFFGPSYPPEDVWDLKGFFAVYGFLGCVVIIFVSKALGKYWLLRPEDHYEPYRAPAEVGQAAEVKEGGHDA